MHAAAGGAGGVDEADPEGAGLLEGEGLSWPSWEEGCVTSQGVSLPPLERGEKFSLARHLLPSPLPQARGASDRPARAPISGCHCGPFYGP